MNDEIKLDDDKKKALDEICSKLRELGFKAQIKTEQDRESLAKTFTVLKVTETNQGTLTLPNITANKMTLGHFKRFVRYNIIQNFKRCEIKW